VCVSTDYSADLEYALGIDIIHQKRASALYLMKLKETRQLSQVALDDVVEGSRMIFLLLFNICTVVYVQN